MNRNWPLAMAVSATFATHFALGAEPQHSGELTGIVVSATPLGGDRLSTAQPTSVIAGDDLVLSLAPTIGQTVAAEPGVHSTFFGPGASRPVIRGLGGDRVQVLTDGLATLDASGLSEDHAVAIDPALADQIEVVRGPATLLYGSGAAGGIVNVVTNRLHDRVQDGVEGLVELRGDSVLEERAVAGRVDAGARRLALHLDAVWRKTDDYDIPGFAQSRQLRDQLIAEGEEPSDERGKVENSWSETRSGSAGLSYVGDRWVLGLAWSRHDTEYGIPGGHEHEEEPGAGEEEHEEGGVFIDLEQDRVDLALRRDFANGNRLRVTGALNDYQHAEVEPSGEVGTLYEVDGREVRLALDHALPGGFNGTGGVQWQEVELVATGEEAFVPESRTRTLGAFLFEQRDFERFTLELGARLDRQEIEGLEVPGYDGTAVNLSAGVIWPLGGGLALVGQLVRSARHPSATELYADGPHAATGQYEIGDPGFDPEVGLQGDVGVRFDGSGISAELRAFVADYDGYLFLSPTGEVEDELPVYQFLQEDARFYGFEAAASFPLGAAGWSLGLSADSVRGRLDQGGDLPRIPPLRLGAELSWQRERLRATLAAHYSFGQDQVAANELPTDAFTMLNAEFSWRPGSGKTLLFLRGTNLLNEEVRYHTSPLKDEMPLPGRSLAAGVRFSFGR